MNIRAAIADLIAANIVALKRVHERRAFILDGINTSLSTQDQFPCAVVSLPTITVDSDLEGNIGYASNNLTVEIDSIVSIPRLYSPNPDIVADETTALRLPETITDSVVTLLHSQTSLGGHQIRLLLLNAISETEEDLGADQLLVRTELSFTISYC